jgi:hypothetical protein
MDVYALIAEPYSDMEWLLGVYDSTDAAEEAWSKWHRRGEIPFYRIERRELNGIAAEYMGEI